MLSPRAIEASIALALLVSAYIFGWKCSSWKSDSDRLDQVRAESADQIATLTIFESTANRTLTELQAAKGTQTIIKREVIREVNPYAGRPCFDPDLVRVLNDAAGQKRPGIPDGEVRPNPAGVD